MPNRETGDGPNIAGNASAGSDFVGRDAYVGRDAPGRDVVGRDSIAHDTTQGNSVHIAMERMTAVSERGTDTIRELSHQIETLADDVTALTRALIGDALYGSTGLMQQVKEMSETNMRRERWRQINAFMLLLVAISQIVQWWLLYRVYELYWVIFRAVETAGRLS